MSGKKIKYKCANCGWEASILAEWSDLKPKRCANKRCNTSFQAYPDKLLIELPEGLVTKKTVKKRKKVEKPAEPPKKSEAKQESQPKKAENDEKRSSSKQETRREVKQQFSETEKESEKK